MSDFNFTNYQIPSLHDVDRSTKLCLCCLAKNVTLITLGTCEHYEALKKLCSVKIPLRKMNCLICCQCHARLKTVYKFKLQAEESFIQLWKWQLSLDRREKLEEVQELNKEVQLVDEDVNLEYQQEQLIKGTIVKPEEHYVTEYQEVLSSSCQSVQHQSSDNAAQTDDIEVHWQNIKEDDNFAEIYEEPGGVGSSTPRFKIARTRTVVTDYTKEAQVCYTDNPQDYEVLLEEDVEPLVKIERNEEIELPDVNVDEERSGRKQVSYSKSKRKKPGGKKQKGLLYCSKCDKKFTTKRKHTQHNLVVHRKPGQPKVTKKVSSAPEIERPSRNSKRFTVDNCGEMAKFIKLTYEELMLERETKRKSETYLRKVHKCESCIVHFTREQNLREHNEKNHQLKENTFQCDICKTVLTTNEGLKEHENRHYKRFECVVCQKRYHSLRVLIDHFIKLHDPKNKITFSCDLCDFTTTTDRSYKYHKEKFHQSKKFLCLHCNINFTAKGSLKSHNLHVHNNKREKFPCEECNMTYYSEKYLAFHIRTVHEPPSLDADSPATASDSTTFFCDTCNKYFKGKLKSHLKNHKNHRRHEDKKYICDICSERYFIKSELKYHIIWKHLKLKKFTCPECQKGFESNNNLNKHINYVHNKFRPPRDKICDYCGKGFRTNVTLQSHIRSHTGERPYHCAHCPATFAHSGALYTHKKIVHKQARKRKL